MKKFMTVAFFVAFALVCTCGMASAQEYAPMTAKITAMKGDAFITKSGATTAFKANIGDILAKGDKIETRSTGDVEIKTQNGNMVNLGPNSHVVISELSLDKASGNYMTEMNSKYGKIMAKVEAKIKDHTKSKFVIKTPSAICGARGTTFYVVTDASGNTSVFVAAGSVNMSDPTGQNVFVVVENAAAAASAAGGPVVELTGDAKAAVLAEYDAFVAAQADLGGDTGEGGGDDVNAPSQQDDPQSLTEVTPQQNPAEEKEPESPSPSDSGSGGSD